MRHVFNLPIIPAELKAFYDSFDFPEHLQNILHFLRISRVTHLIHLSSDNVNEIQDDISNKKFAPGILDLNSPSDQKKCFGVTFTDISKFEFSFIELLQLEALAQEAKKYTSNMVSKAQPTQQSRASTFPMSNQRKKGSFLPSDKIHADHDANIVREGDETSQSMSQSNISKQ